MREPTAIEERSEEIGDLYRREGARLWRAVFAYAQDPAIASDAVAEAFAQCLGRGEAVRDPRAWVWQAAFRLAGGELKRRGATTTLSEVQDVVIPADQAPGELLDALRQLSPNQRATLILRFYAGYGTDEVASILAMARATVRVHTSRGRKRLRAILSEESE
jgi:RNA polymerase sigma-70 factor (ECF subfamily)